MNDRDLLIRYLRKVHAKMRQLHPWDCGCPPTVFTIHRRLDRPGFVPRLIHIDAEVWSAAEYQPQRVLSILKPDRLIAAENLEWTGTAISMEAWAVAEPEDDRELAVMRSAAGRRMLYARPDRMSVRNTFGVLADGTAAQVLELQDGPGVTISDFEQPGQRAGSGVLKELMRLNDRTQAWLDVADMERP